MVEEDGKGGQRSLLEEFPLESYSWSPYVFQGRDPDETEEFYDAQEDCRRFEKGPNY
jgi:hypothetical protein